MSSLAAPERVWWKPLGRDEKLWVTLSLAWGLVMFALMWAWPVVGRQNAPSESYRVDVRTFRTLADEFVRRYRVGEVEGVPLVRPPDGANVYLVARTFQFQPVLELQQGKTYRIYVSSLDLQHGLSIQPVNMNFQVLPGYVTVLNLTPTQAGEFTLVCNEYCGPGHRLMTGRIIVRG